MRFNPDQIERFRLTALDVDVERGVVDLGYALDDDWTFTERVSFGPRRAGVGPELDDGFGRVARLLHLAAGVSYYKAAAPAVLAVETGPLTDLERRFVVELYDKGLREFAWHNGLPLERRLTVDAPPPSPPGGAPAPAPGRGGVTAPPARIAVPVGGGKDSAVVAEALRDRDPVLLSVNGHPAARRVAEAAGLELAVVERALDPALLELNDQGARNGHVPITAIVSLVAVAAGFRIGYDTTVMALEGSADEPTRVAQRDGRPAAGSGAASAVTGSGAASAVTGSGAASAVTGTGAASGAAGVAVNHQWSKSSEFEAVLTAALAGAVGPAVRYRSVLRDAGELDIAAAFATMPRYHRAFLSCNQAFGRSGRDGWCGACPKCRFVYLALATAMPPDRLAGIFGRDLLRDATQAEGFRDLLEEDRKPFECVGTRAESLAAIAELAGDRAWADAAVVRSLAPVAAAQGAVPAAHLAPAELVRRIRSAVDAEDPG